MLTSVAQVVLWGLVTLAEMPHFNPHYPYPFWAPRSDVGSCIRFRFPSRFDPRWILPIEHWTDSAGLWPAYPWWPSVDFFTAPDLVAPEGWKRIGGLARVLSNEPLREAFQISNPYRLEQPEQTPDFNGQASSQLEGPWGSLKSQMQVEAVRAAEVREAERWQAEENLQVPVTGPLYVYGQVSANYNTWTAQQKTLSGRTGVGCKLKPLANSEIILSGGSVTNYSEDPLQPRQLPVEKSQLIVELQARYSVLGALKLEYQGSAMPALSTLDHNRVQQDFRFALPLGSAGDVRIGAKHQWEDIPGAPRPWTDSMQLYFGLGLKR